MEGFRKKTLGIVLVFVISVIASILGKLAPVVGAPIFAIMIGVVLNNFSLKPIRCIEGVNLCSKKLLQPAIILLGCGLSFKQVLSTGAESFGVMVLTLISAFVATKVVGDILKVEKNIKTLIGVGTAICGGSAIAAISPIIEADDTEIAYSISTIFLFNVIAVFIFPLVGHILNFSDTGFGLWAGTAINDTSSVVSAGYSYSYAAGNYATIVKLTRTTMIIPISFIYAIITSLEKKKTTVVKM